MALATASRTAAASGLEDGRGGGAVRMPWTSASRAAMRSSGEGGGSGGTCGNDGFCHHLSIEAVGFLVSRVVDYHQHAGND